MRHVLQLTGPATNLAALCDDGTMWTFAADTAAWTQLPPVPGQPGTTTAEDATVQHDRVAIERQERAEQARRDRFQSRP